MERLDDLDEALVAFLCERTNYTGDEIRTILDLFDEFCNRHKEEIMECFDDSGS